MNDTETVVGSPRKSKVRKSAFREWLESILFAVAAATIIRWLFFSAFVIPTPSMENSLLVGDYLFVSKVHYGTTTPVTPLQIPLSHQTIWGSSIPSYLDWVQLPQYRLPGFTEVRKGDVVVFTLPVEHPDAYSKYSNVLPDLRPHPVDLRSNYIKRCIAIAGDTMELRQGQVYINGILQKDPRRVQNEYFVSTTAIVNEENVFRKNGIVDYSQFTETYDDSTASNDEFGYIVKTTPELIAKLQTYDFVKRVQRILLDFGLKEPFLFPASDFENWNKDNYGPILVPKKGMKLNMSPLHVDLYGEIIKNYEGNENVVVENGQVKLNGKVLTDYTFRQDYYFMMGDNRHDSADSRYWGFVPKDHIVGKAVFVWMSVDPDPVSFFKKIRWDRIFRIIE